MGLLRRGILMASQSPWMREHAPRFGFMRRTVTRFMPGEDVHDALSAAHTLAASGIHSVLTHLGENITDRDEATDVTQHYLDVTNRILTAKTSHRNFRKAHAARPRSRRQILLRKSRRLIDSSPTPRPKKFSG